MLTWICLMVMLAIMMIRCRLYSVRLVMVLPLAICVAAMGLLGTRIMFFLENGAWNGKSFFGAVLFFPPLLWPVAGVFKVPLKKLLSYATPPGLVLLAIQKLNCYRLGCCSGKVLYYTEAGIPIHFPSQLFEMFIAVVLALILIFLEQKEQLREKIYPLCLITYGIARYVLNCFRWEQGAFLFGMPAGNVWSIISVVIGVSWIALETYSIKGKRMREKE